jgi:hypothetical protein
MKNPIAIMLLVFVTWPVLLWAQRPGKPWNEWSKQETEKVLNDSPWAQTQTETDVSEMFFRLEKAPDARGGGSSPNTTPDERGGATNQATSVKYRIRFLSAKPIRQAIARSIESRQTADDVVQVRAFMQEFVSRKFDRWIAVTVTVESQDQRYLGQATQAFGSAVAEILKNKSYLERKDGKRIFLQLYQAPSQDGLGAKFIFPREIDGAPFLTATSGEVRFVAEISKKLTLDKRFKVADMIYDGQLEY